MFGLKGDRWPLKWALIFLGATTCTTMIVGVSCIYFYECWRKERRINPKFNITHILQTGPEKEALPTDCLAELLSLSSDLPNNLYAFDLKKGEKALLRCPVIAKANLKRKPPSTLIIDYEVRRPIAMLADYENVAIDEEGYLFPIHPFLPPKQIPELYLGLPPFSVLDNAREKTGGNWHEPLQNKQWELAQKILKYFAQTPWKEGFFVQRIDLSNAFAPTLGRREIVLFTSEEVSIARERETLVFSFPKILRLPTKNFELQLQNFFSLRSAMQQDYARQLASFRHGATFAPRIVDLRLAHLAFVENRPE